MNLKVTADGAPGQSQGQDYVAHELSRERDQLAEGLSQAEDHVVRLAAIARAQNWTAEALEAHAKANRQAALGSASYIGKVLRRDRSMSFEFFCALPRGVRLEFYAEELERDGAVVVRPARGEAAVRRFAEGLLGLVVAQFLPAHSSGQLKTSLPPGVLADRRRAG